MAKIICFLMMCCLHAEEPLCSLTPRETPLCAETLKRLAYMGIKYTFTAPFRETIEIKHPGFTHKAKIFQKWLELFPIRPSKKVFIDMSAQSASYHRAEESPD